MSNTMKKLASQVPAVLAETGRHMSKLASRNVELEQENSALRHELRLHKLAHRMEERGLEQSLSFEEKVAHLQSVPTGKLDALEQAVELTHGGFKLGSLQEPDTNPNDNGVAHMELGSAAHEKALDDFIMSGRALS